jgi:hypothetical protein
VWSVLTAIIARISQLATAVERARSVVLRVFLGFNVFAVGAGGVFTT